MTEEGREHFYPRRRQYAALAALCASNAAEAVEVLSAGYILERATGDSAARTLIAAFVYVGMLLGGLVSGILADALGRTKVLRAAMLLSTASTFAAALSPSLPMLVCARLFAGVGVGAATPPIFALAAELLPSHQSGAAIASVASFWMVGSVYTAAAALLLIADRPDPTWAFRAEWRFFALVCGALPATATVLVFTSVYDPSPAGLPPEGTLGSSGIQSRGSGLLDPSAMERSPAASETGSAPEAQLLHGPATGCAHMWQRLTAPDVRTALPPLALAWCGLNFGYYGMATWITVLLSDAGVANPYFVALLYACANLPGNLASIVLVDRLGRRPLLGLSMGLAAAAALSAASQIDSPRTALVVAAAVAFNAFATAGWNALDALSAESFATDVRATTFGLLAAFGRVSSILAQVINGSLASSPTLLLIVTSIFMGIGCTSVCCMPVKDPTR